MFDAPEYIVVEEFSNIVDATRVALTMNTINYLYGYVNELNETLIQWAKDPAKAKLKFPLVWFEEPFTIQRGNDLYFGIIPSLRIFIINDTKAEYKSQDRLNNVFKPIILPIYRELIKQIDQSLVFSTGPGMMRHNITNRYYWGENQQNYLVDKIDCAIIEVFNLPVSKNSNCTPLKSL